MANHKSAKKRIRSSKKRARANKRVLNTLRSCEKSLRKDLAGKNAKAVEEGLKNLFKLADRAKNKGVIKKNTVRRKKARFSLKSSALKASPENPSA